MSTLSALFVIGEKRTPNMDPSPWCPPGPSEGCCNGSSDWRAQALWALGFGIKRLSPLGFPCSSPLQRGCESREEPSPGIFLYEV